MFDGVNDIIFKQPDRVVTPLNWVEHIPFAFKLVEVLKPRVIVELGVHSGNSFCAFNQAIKMLKLSSKCYGVDTWLGDSQAGFYNSDVFDSLSEYLNGNYQDSAILMKCTFDDALDSFEDHSIDLLHIDGLHDHESVLRDFNSWKCKLSDRSVILFHDTQVLYDGYGVQKLWHNIRDEFVSFEFEHSFGLGVLLFGSNYQNDVLRLIEYAKNKPDYVSLIELVGSQIFYRYKSLELEIELNQMANLAKTYSSSSSYKIGKMLLGPLKKLK
jgi:hypothetical protein